MAALSVGAKSVYEARSFFGLTVVARPLGSEETEWHRFDREFGIPSDWYSGKGAGNALDRPVDADHAV